MIQLSLKQGEEVWAPEWKFKCLDTFKVFRR